ncbi:flavin reductase family protein [Glycomyces tenuis]|uniref:flavin reductase family protein n=1 Tax=Glycomyces tenuis TaxID=58116 RepID=UPI0003F84563|nr:flavin reductase family protein [Glycomyces tenuis]
MTAPTETAPLPEAPGVAADDFRALFRTHPAGVAVVCADAGAGPAGFTATSLTSLSMRPPLISFAIATGSSAWPTFREASSVTVNLLAAGQHAIADRFATSGIDRFAHPTLWSRLETGEPVLDEAPAHLRALVRERIEAGDHRLIIALVTDVEAGIRDPLVYHAGAYCAAAPID